MVEIVYSVHFTNSYKIPKG